VLKSQLNPWGNHHISSTHILLQGRHAWTHQNLEIKTRLFLGISEET